MNNGSGHPLVYPLAVTTGALAITFAWAPFADPDQLSALIVVGLAIVIYTGYRLAVAFGTVAHETAAGRPVAVRRVRQEHRLHSRSWLELRGDDTTHWLPVFFTPELVGFIGGTAEFGRRGITVRESGPAMNDTAAGSSRRPTASAADEPAGSGRGLRLLPAGRLRDDEPPGRLLDNSSRPDPAAGARATASARIPRRLLLDAQAAVAAPFLGLLWVYVVGGGLPAFAGCCCVTAAAAVWLSAIRGSDPS